jgi:hypothetical protein
MTREFLAEGEKPLFWVGSSRKDLLRFPEAVRIHIGAALGVAQFGSMHPDAKPWKGDGSGVLEIVEDHRGDTFEPCTPFGLRKRFMCCSRFRRSRRRASGRQRPTRI